MQCSFFTSSLVIKFFEQIYIFCRHGGYARQWYSVLIVCSSLMEHQVSVNLFFYILCSYIGADDFTQATPFWLLSAEVTSMLMLL